MSKCGTTSGYSMGCRCPACAEAKREYNREYLERSPKPKVIDMQFTALHKDAYESNARAMEKFGMSSAASKWRRALAARRVISPFGRVDIQPTRPVEYQGLWVARRKTILDLLKSGEMTSRQISDTTKIPYGSVKDIMTGLKGDGVSGYRVGNVHVWTIGEANTPLPRIKVPAPHICERIHELIATPKTTTQLMAEVGRGRSTVNRALNELHETGRASIVSTRVDGGRTWVAA